MPKARALWRAPCLRAFAITAGLIVAPVLAGSGSASAQGLFEALFGQRRFPASAADLRSAPPASGVWRAAPPGAALYAQAHHPRTPGASAEASAKPAPYVAPPVMPGPLGKFLRDPTLRRGDVVATADGLMIFRGSSGSRHSPKDFVPVSQAGGLVAAIRRTELAKLDRRRSIGMTAAGKPSCAEVAEKEAPIVAQDEGRRIALRLAGAQDLSLRIRLRRSSPRPPLFIEPDYALKHRSAAHAGNGHRPCSERSWRL